MNLNIEKRIPVLSAKHFAKVIAVGVFGLQLGGCGERRDDAFETTRDNPLSKENHRIDVDHRGGALEQDDTDDYPEAVPKVGDIEPYLQRVLANPDDLDAIVADYQASLVSGEDDVESRLPSLLGTMVFFKAAVRPQKYAAIIEEFLSGESKRSAYNRVTAAFIGGGNTDSAREMIDAIPISAYRSKELSRYFHWSVSTQERIIPALSEFNELEIPEDRLAGMTGLENSFSELLRNNKVSLTTLRDGISGSGLDQAEKDQLLEKFGDEKK